MAPSESGGPVRPTRLQLASARCYDRLVRRADPHWEGPVRRRLLGGLTGRVLDIGAGTGKSLPDLAGADRVTAVEPAPGRRALLAERARDAPVPVEVADADAEHLPYPDASFDAVCCVLMLCSVGDPARALAEIRRVLVPGGAFAFIEHVREEEPGARARVQRAASPLQRVLLGCDLRRRTEEAIGAAGFAVGEITRNRPFGPLVPSQPIIAGRASAPR
ncbi:class I SAM-dependent methyltransferase [Nocardiopsis composta]|uniref:Ubiquinone/menaquinone biosynthesis C-methylase UbiE n=1 Tax=Nocardiopsis composta TaxID=157465 RepID=A0A7W8VCY9_9ACTN|nr:class I SAM-dependent methyltransferase [Nocardiopsis composta]MBB5431712.1 ubiquinone/menaquinone biosynthesis C-methylase UbiE [Nocardiopsis composta]